MSRTKSRLAPRLEVSGFHERRNIMANILKRIYRIFNGTDWDIVHLETDSEQVKHDTTTVKAKLDALKSGALATVVNNLTTTAANTVLDGRQGKALNDKITTLNSALTGKQDSLQKGDYTGSLTLLRTPGVYYCDFSKVTGSIYNSGYGWVVIERANLATDGSCIQKVYRLNDAEDNNVITQIIIRPYVNKQWYPWRVIQTGEVRT